MDLALTGMGVLTTLGVGAGAAFDAMLAGQTQREGPIPGFDPAAFLARKGLRHFDRTALLLASAAQMALDDAGLSADTYGAERLGVVAGSTHGSIQAIAEFDQEAVREGPKDVNPQQFANTVINAPASRVGLLFGANGVNSTVSTGIASALDALDLAGTLLAIGREKALLCGAAIGQSTEIADGYGRAGRLVTAEAGCVPFSAGREGASLSEGAAVFSAEAREAAEGRGARVHALLSGRGSAFGHGPGSLAKAMRGALASAGIEAGQVGCAVASASGSPEADLEEGAALQEVFGRIVVTAPKASTGDCLEASGAIAVAVAVKILETGRVPPIARLEQVDPGFAGLDLVRGSARALEAQHVLVSACDPEGHCSALVLSGAP